MTSHLDSFGTTDIKPKILSGVQTGNGTAHDKHDIRGTAHACKNRRADYYKASHIYWSGGKEFVHQQSTHGAGHIPLCGIFVRQCEVKSQFSLNLKC